MYTYGGNTNLKIQVRNNNVEKALRLFKKMSKDKLIDLRDHEYYEKPSAARRKAKKAAIQRDRSNNARN